MSGAWTPGKARAGRWVLQVRAPCVLPWSVLQCRNHPQSKYTIRRNDSRMSMLYGGGHRRPQRLAQSGRGDRQAPPGAPRPSHPGASLPPSRWHGHITRFINSNTTPVALICALIAGWNFPTLGTALSQRNLSPYTTAAMFFISGIVLRAEEAQQALRCPTAILYGLASVLVLTSSLAPLVLRLGLAPLELAIGFVVFCCMPTTLSTGVILTQAVGGNAAVALLLTVLSNLLSVVTVPILLQWALGPAAAQVGNSFRPATVAKNLAMTVLLPLLAGVAFQAVSPAVREWRVHNRRTVAYASAGLLAFIPWTQISRAAAERLPLTPRLLATIAAVGLGLHLVFLALNLTLTGFMRFVPGDDQADMGVRRAVVLCSSQKTLPIAIAVLAQLAAGLGPGTMYAALACIAAHLIQTLFDSVMVSVWLRQDAAGGRAKR